MAENGLQGRCLADKVKKLWITKSTGFLCQRSNYSSKPTLNLLYLQCKLKVITINLSWDNTPCQIVKNNRRVGLTHPEDVGSTSFRNVDLSHMA